MSKKLKRNLLIGTQALTMSWLLAGSGRAQVPVPGGGSYSGTSSYSEAKKTVSPDIDLTGGVQHNARPADKLLSQGKYSDAEETFREALVSNPGDVNSMAGLGIALAKQFKLDGADEMFERVLRQDPNNSLAYAGKATIILNRLQSSSGTIRSNKESFLKQAEEYSQQAVRLSPASAEAHFTLGQTYKEQGKDDQAASEFRTAISLDPQHSNAYNQLGHIKLLQNSLAEAQENFTRSIDLNSGNSSAHFGLGATLLKEGRVDEAIKELNTSLYQFPNSWPVRIALGEAYQRQGNEVAALKEYQQSILIKPENAEPYLRIADIRENRGDLELAIADLRSGLTQMPYNIDLRQRIADLALKLEKADDAIKGYRTILQMSPNDNRAVKGLSQALYLKAQKAAVGALLASNDYEAALKTLDEAIKLNADDMELRLSQAKLMSLSGTKPDLAKLGTPQNDGEKVAAAEALMAQGNFQQCSQYMQEVIGRLNDSKQSFAVGDVALMIKDLDDAEAAYKKAQSLSGSPDRVQRGLNEVTRLRKSAVDDTKVADELAKKNQWDGALDRYRQAVAVNPKYADARVGLARALEKKKKPSSANLAESAMQYENYLVLKTDLPTKDAEKMRQQIGKLREKSAEMAQKEQKNKAG
ncbi:MAG: tetratricopeptide repeat protein [Candidatus Obscuribacterales bacterium]|nr:tetratricopeptide repeat protein [Candidatus Obscuribacterales bacterium]